MAAKGDRDRRGIRAAGVVLAGLFVLVVLANLLWPGPVPASGIQPRMSPTASPFPTLRMGSVLHVVPIDGDANLSLRLLMTSMQGMVNRAAVELYLDVEGGVSSNTSDTLSFLRSRYHVTADALSLSAAIDAYAPRASGLIVFDPMRPESIDIGTMIAAQQGALLVGPDLAGWLHARYGLPMFDYASSDWAASDAIGSYDRALRELLPASSNTTLSILPPGRWAIRDYLIATRTFVFYLPQGALASPAETAATMRILRATPRGIPILGWFDSPTLTEENSFVQMASQEGKFVVGVQDVPNLSVLTALGRNETHRQVSSSPAIRVLENKAYVVLAVPDGDNLDFAAGRMRKLWADPIRGTMPVAWSLSPLLVDLAPPLVDRYYDEATPLDRFVAAPSGAGYLYPDFTGPGDLAPFVAFSDRYLRAADMDVVWLLNAFRASETPYASASLSAYVDGLRPEGIVLDYDDQPKTRDAWMQAGTEAVAPVVRSTHFWTTADNVLGKLDAAMSTWDRGPHFLWLTVYSFRFDLRDARDLVNALSARLDGNLEVVTPTEFFGLMQQDFIRTARESLAAAEGDPLAVLLFGPSLEAARTRLGEADAYLAMGDGGRGANAAFLALEIMRSISSSEALLASLLVILAGAVLAFLAQRSSRRAPTPRDSFSPGTVLLVAASIALLVFSLREALEQNFWTYPTILIAVAFGGVYRPLSRVLDRGYPERAPVAASLIALVFTALAIRTSAAFPLAVIGSLLAIESYLSRRPAGSAELLAGLAFGTALGFLGGFDLPTFSGLAVLLVLASFGVRGPPVTVRPGRPPPALPAGFVLALPLSALAVGSYYTVALRLQIQGDLLSVLAGGLLVLAPMLAIFARRALPALPPTRSETAGLALAAAFGGLVLASRGTTVTFLALLALFASLSFSAMSALDAHAAQGGEPRRALALAILFLPLFALFFGMPPVVYSLTLVHLPETVEYALYAPSVMIAAVALILALALSARTRLRAGVGKNYCGEVHGGAGRP